MIGAEVIGTGFGFTEAPRWHDGALWFSDFYHHRVVRWDGSRFHTVCRVPGQPSGLGFTAAGDLLVVSMLDRRLLRWRDGQLSVHADLSRWCEGPANDLVLDDRGRAYVGNDGSTRPLRSTGLIRCDDDGAVEVVATGVVTPNGMVVSADGRTLFVAETFAGRISAWEIDDAGTLGERRTWAAFAPPEVPDSLASARTQALLLPDGIVRDARGRLWVADAAGSGVWCMDEGGEIVAHVDTGPFTAYSVVLGGDEGRTLFIAAGPALDDIRTDGREQSAILRVRVDVPADGL